MGPINKDSLAECIDLMLAGEMARIYGLNVPAKIRKVARRIRDTTRQQEMLQFCKVIIKGTDAKVAESFNWLYTALKQDGYI